MENREQIRKKIEKVLNQIEREKSFNSDSGSLSFLYYQLWTLQKELEVASK